MILSPLLKTRQKIAESFSSRDFIKAVSMIIGMVIPVAIGAWSDMLSVGIHVTLGVLFVSFSDTSGSVRLQVQGMFLTILLTLMVTYIMHFLKLPLPLFLPVLGGMIFCIAYLSVYGFRASLISFSGLFSIVLSMSSVSDSELSIYSRLLYIGIGGLWYISLVLVRYILFPKNSTEYHLAEALEFTADYLEIRAKLVDKKNDRKELIKDLLEKQNELTETHETLRELLLSRRLVSGKSNYQARRALLLREIIDVLELAMANPVNYFKIDEIFEENPGKQDRFQAIVLAMSQRFRYLFRHFGSSTKIKPDQKIAEALQQMKEDILQLIQEREKQGVKKDDDILALKNYWRYLKSQYAKIRKIEYLILNKQLPLHTSNLDRESPFLTKQDWGWKVLLDNFNKRSSIFRHSVRIAIIGMLGYGLGLLLNVVNAYWILMTVIIIMRPNFGLTKERFRDRSIGTVIGGALAFGVIYFVQNSTVYGILAVLCYAVGLSMVHRNYKAAAAFITMYVLFVYGMLHPDVFKFIQFRVLDTLLGAGLAFIGGRMLWPFWEIKGIDKTLKGAIDADRDYLVEIGKLYNQKGKVTTAYKLKRKEAFLSLSEVSAAFQRMTQEPRSQHKSLNEVFQLVMLMHSFLASLASLGAYIVNNETTPASKDFNKTVAAIIENLNSSSKMLDHLERQGMISLPETTDMDREYEERLVKISEENQFDENWEANTEKEEAHLLAEQFSWLMANSQRMAVILKKIKFN